MSRIVFVTLMTVAVSVSSTVRTQSSCYQVLRTDCPAETIVDCTYDSSQCAALDTQETTNYQLYKWEEKRIDWAYVSDYVHPEGVGFCSLDAQCDGRFFPNREWPHFLPQTSPPPVGARPLLTRERIAPTATASPETTPHLFGSAKQPTVPHVHTCPREPASRLEAVAVAAAETQLAILGRLHFLWLLLPNSGNLQR